jgi:ribosomal protein S18 acetylase RimI-like enzyme
MSAPLTWRSPAVEDLPEIEGVARRCNAVYGTLEATLVDSLADRLRWDSGIGDVARVLVDDSRIVAAGWLCSRTAAAEARDCLYAFAEPGCASELYELVGWLTALHPNLGVVHRFERVLAPETDDLPPDQIRLYESLGFERFYTELEMACDLTHVALRDVPGIELLPWSPELHPRTRDAYNEAFAERGFDGYTADEWPTAFYEDDIDPRVSFVAQDGARIVGFVFSSVLNDPDGWTDPAIRGEGAIDTLGVAPAYQRRGIATQLLTRSMSALRATGVRRAVLRVNEDNARARRVYQRLGFRVARKHVVYRKELVGRGATPGGTPAHPDP